MNSNTEYDNNVNELKKCVIMFNKLNEIKNTYYNNKNSDQIDNDIVEYSKQIETLKNKIKEQYNSNIYKYTSEYVTMKHHIKQTEDAIKEFKNLPNQNSNNYNIPTLISFMDDRYKNLSLVSKELDNLKQIAQMCDFPFYFDFDFDFDFEFK
jgi:hypothetical protein